MTIELPGFENIYNGAVYARPIGEKIVDVVLLRRYIEPSEDDVIAYLAEKAGDARATQSLIIPGREQDALKGKTDLEKLLVSLLPQVLQDIKSGSNGAHSFIRSSTPARRLKDGETPNTYLQISNGTIPISVIDKNQEGRETPLDAKRYDLAFGSSDLRKQGYGYQWKTQLALENGTLPSGDLVQTLLFMSNPLAGSKKYDVPAIAAFYGVVSAALSIPEAIMEVRDVSPDALDEVSILPIIAFHEFVKAQIARTNAAGGNGLLGGGGIPGLGRREPGNG